MLDHINLENLIFIDIETVPGHPQFTSLPDELKELYLRKSERLKQEAETHEEQYFNHAGIYDEFGKVICISIGVMKREREKDTYQLRIKSFYGDDEKQLLKEFCDLLNQHYNKYEKYQFCGHNVREFDVPFLCRRLLINELSLPVLLDISGRKPYELNMVDTLYLWRFGDYKHYTSLKLLALIFGIPSPKEDIEGKDVAGVYWKEKNLKRIVEYCQRDVVTVVQLILRFKGSAHLTEERIIFVSSVV